MKTIIIATSLVLSALSLNANEIRSTGEARPSSETTTHISLEATVDALGKKATEALESEARNCIAQNTEATMRYLTDLRPVDRAPNQGFYAQPTLISFMDFSR